MKDFLKRLTDCIKILKSKEYFIAISKEDKNKNIGYYNPIKYSYFFNTNRQIFYIIIKSYIKEKFLFYGKN